MTEFAASTEPRRRSLRAKGVALGLAVTLALTAACTDNDTNGRVTGQDRSYGVPSPDAPKKGGDSRFPGECEGELGHKYTIAYALDEGQIDLLVGVAGGEAERMAALKQYGARVRDDVEKEKQKGIIGPTDWIAISGLIGYSQDKTQGEARRQAQILTANMSAATRLPMYDSGAAYEAGGNVGTLHIYAFGAQACPAPETTTPLDIRA